MKVVDEKTLREAAAKGRVDRAIFKKPLPPDVEKMLLGAIDRLAAACAECRTVGPAAPNQDNQAILSAIEEAIGRIKIGAPPPPQYQPPDYEFTIHRDMNGRIESVSAHAVPAN